MSTKFTPGPWKQDRWGKVMSPSGETIRVGGLALAMKDDDETRANDRLIAAAPEYYDAAEEILQAVTANAAPINPMDALAEMWVNGDHVTLDAGLIFALMTAHAKATGEQP